MILKCTGIRYFKTNRGLGYQCKTNAKGVEILNDGNGGGTYLSGRLIGSLTKFNNLTERQLESVLNKYERSKGVIC